jgi:tryptophanyl-tRNA synthetase
MSKSYNNTINLSDSEAVIKQKVSTMFTDPKRIKLSDKGHPESCNVFTYFSTFTPEMKEEVLNYCINARVGCTECKKNLATGMIKRLKPLHEKREELSKDKAKVKKILKEGAERANEVTAKTISEVKEAMHL